MKKVLLILIIAMFALTTLKTDTESETYVDFDDVTLPEVVVV
jgi:hypothetical protein